jgi:hypothetical protein
MIFVWVVEEATAMIGLLAFVRIRLFVERSHSSGDDLRRRSSSPGSLALATQGSFSFLLFGRQSHSHRCVCLPVVVGRRTGADRRVGDVDGRMGRTS